MLSPQLLEVLTKATGYFKDKGVPQARLDAELLLAKVLGIKRLDLYLQFDRPLSGPELDGYRKLVRRRGLREPLQHIIGDVEFREITLKVDGRSLIPRQETELLLELVKRFLPKVTKPRLVDIGVGSGAILLSILREHPHCEVSGSDVDVQCLDLTRENALVNNLPIPALFHGHLFDAFPANSLWNMIVSNPPYIGENELASLEPEVRNFDPRTALIGGPEGWELPSELLRSAWGHLEPEGILILEIDPRQFSLLKEQALKQGWRKIEGHSDYQEVNRFFVAMR